MSEKWFGDDTPSDRSSKQSSKGFYRGNYDNYSTAIPPQNAGKTFGGGGGYTQCYKTHPVLKVGKFEIYGSSASNPNVTDADVYVSLQDGSTCGLLKDPWESGGPIEVRYPIVDTRAPKNVERFKKMIDWLCNQLQEGKKVHVGCIGGHGRTGLVLSAIAAELGEKDAIRYVRENYCKKAVETQEQVEFLVKNFGVLPVGGSKSFAEPITKGTSEAYTSKHGSPSKGKSYQESLFGTSTGAASPAGKHVVRPVPSARSLWRSKKKKKS